jgi:hypothetical protein
VISKENTELLTRVDAGSLMGDLMRQYWLPCVYGSELTPDSDPLRVRMLGEDLIAWRDSTGTPSFIANNCPHRGASLFFGRDDGIPSVRLQDNAVTSMNRILASHAGTVVGKVNSIAGTDCGVGSRVWNGEIAWAKFAAMAEGGRIATRELWP